MVQFNSSISISFHRELLFYYLKLTILCNVAQYKMINERSNCLYQGGTKCLPVHILKFIYICFIY